jgi:hypothetical protein
MIGFDLRAMEVPDKSCLLSRHISNKKGPPTDLQDSITGEVL